MTPSNAVEHILRDLPSAAAATFLGLFPIVNPFGGVPMFFTLTSNFPPAERNHTALKTAAYVIVFGFLLLAIAVRSSRLQGIEGAGRN